MKTITTMTIFFLIVLGGCLAVNSFGQTWTQTAAPSNSWQSVACSADGTKIAAIANDGIYFSTNSGITWFSNSASLHAMALSADGNKWAAVNFGTYVYTSTNWGASWAAINALTQEFYYDFSLTLVASSADGNKLVVGPDIYTSNDSGMTWMQRNVSGDAIACSADGIKLFAVNASSHNEPFGIYISTNSGDTWFSNSAPVFFTESIAASADGNKLALVVGHDGIYVSTNMAATWTKTANVPTAVAVSIVSSADGSRIAASVGQTLYLSCDSGMTWTTNTIPNGGVALSADGNKIIAAVNGGGIWILQTPPSPSISTAMANGDLALSWLVPSTDLVLQQSADLSVWTDLTNTPILNFADLQNEVTLPLSGGNNFYRLKTR